MSTTKYSKKSTCPCCGYEFNAATDVRQEGNVPEAGDFTICFGCASILVFTDDDGNVRPAEHNDLKDTDRESLEILAMAKDGVERIIAARSAS